MDGSLKIALILSAYDKMTAVVNNATNKAQAKLRSFAKKASEIGSNAFDFAKRAGSIGLVAGGLLAGPIKAAADMERMNVALRTSFQGNEIAANQAFKTINAFAAQTPYELEEVMRGFMKLKNMGLDPSKDALQAYGNTASAMGKSLNDMVEAVADAATGEFERLKEFGIKASSQGSKVTFTFQGVKTTVGKNSKEIEAYLKKLGNTKFAGGIEAQSKTIYGQWSTLTDQFKMTAAQAGATLIPVLNKLFQKITPIIDKVAKWIERNPKLTEQILMAVAAFAALNLALSAGAFLFGGLAKFAGITSTALSVLLNPVKYLFVGKMKLLRVIVMLKSGFAQWAGIVAKGFNIIRVAIMSNPILAILSAIAFIAFLVIKNWSQVVKWFREKFTALQKFLAPALNVMKKIFLNFTPAGLIFKHWDKIGSYFVNLWARVKNIFFEFVKWFVGLHVKFFNAGANIGKSIWNGIKAFINKPIEAVKGMVQKIRNMLPFSPAKEGPLRDIHKIRLVETIAESIKPASMVKAFQKVAVSAKNILLGSTPGNAAIAPVAAGSGGGTINATFHIHLSGNATRSDAALLTKEIKRQFKELMRQYVHDKARVSF